MQARYYDPVIGRFYSNDPIGFRDVHSFNRYAYANNNPYKYVDPDGKAVFTAIAIGAARCASNAACRGAAISLGKAIIGAFAEEAKKDPYKPTKRRVKLRKKTKEKITENTPTNENGDELGPNGEVLNPEQIDIGHKPGQEWRKRKKMHEEQGSTREEVIEAENDPDLYRKEDRSRNRSHKDEEKD